jgi:benzoylformate decarboxylase
MPKQEDIEDSAELLLKAKAPLIIAGSEIGRAGAVEQLVELAELLGSAVVIEDDVTISDTCFPNAHPLCVGLLDPADELKRPKKALNELLNTPDVVFGAGCKMFMEFRYPKKPYIPLNAKLIHMFPEPLEIGRIYRTEIGLSGNIALQLGQLLEAAKTALKAEHRPNREEYDRRVRAARRELTDWLDLKGAEGKDATPVRTHQVMRILSHVAPDNTLLVDEAIRSGPALLAHFDFNLGRDYLGNNGGCLGWGIPAAIGAKIANQDRPVVAVIGNGSTLFAIQGLWTAANQGTGVIFVIINNHAYMAVKSVLCAYGGRSEAKQRYLGCELENPPIDFVLLAKGFGVPAQRCFSPNEFKQAVEEALKQKGPALIEVVVDEKDYEGIGVME